MKILKLFLLSPLLFLGSCFDDDTNYKDYAEWREENIKYIQLAETEIVDGHLRYEKIIPQWDKSVFSLIEWHNDKNQNTGSIYPLSNSTVDVKYLLTNIKGDTLDSSSSFRCRPGNMITGFCIALTNMLPGDSVTAVIPSDAGYGASSYGSVLPYSTLIFNIRLDSIVAYETLPWR